MEFGKAARLVSAVLLATTAASCASGGGGGTSNSVNMSTPPASPPPPPPPPPPAIAYPSATSSEYLINWGLADTKAITAWRDGSDGAGVTIGVIDDGFEASDPELKGRISSSSIDINSTRNTLFDPSGTLTHGSEVAAVAVANYNNSETVGIAFGATVLGVRADSSGGSFLESDIANGIDYAVAHGAKIINLSLGATSPSSTALDNAIANATAKGVIIVASAGNDAPGVSQVEYPAYLATMPSISHGLIIAAGANDQSGNLASFSNPAGNAKNYYLMAPGVGVAVPDFGTPGPSDPKYQVCSSTTHTCLVSGTSYSAPAISAALALIMSAFPSLTPAQVVNLLLTSADDTGATGVDATTGHGKLDIAKAFQPVGTVAAPLTAGGSDVPLNTTLGVSGAAFGDGLVRQSAALTAVGFDALGRSFKVNLASRWVLGPSTPVTSTAPAPGLWGETPWQGRSRAFVGWGFGPDDQGMHAPDGLRRPQTASFLFQTAVTKRVTLGFSRNVAPLAPATPADSSGFLDFAGSAMGEAVALRLSYGLSLSLAAQGGRVDLGPTFGESDRQAYLLRLDGVRGDVSGAVSVGTINEKGAVLGLAWSRAIGGTPDSATSFLSVAGTWYGPFGLQIGGDAEVGRTATAASSGWMQLSAPLTTSAFALGAKLPVSAKWLQHILPDTRAQIGLTVRQPLRVESGRFNVTLPTGNAWGRSSLGYVTRSFDPAPSGREIDVAASYRVWSGALFSAQATVAYENEPGHSASAAPALVASAGIRLRF